MNNWQQPDASSPHVHWKQILGMGEQLLSLARQTFVGTTTAQETITAQRDLILDTAQRLLGGQIALWIPEQVLRDFLGKVQSRALLSAWIEQPVSSLSELMKLSLETQQVYYRFADGSLQCLSSTDAKIEEVPIAVANPLLIRDFQDQVIGLLGVLQIERPSGPGFTPLEIELLNGLAVQASIALQASLQMANEQWRLEQLTLVRQVSIQIADVRDIDELARRITHLILQTFNYYYVAIFTLETGQDILHLRASAGPLLPKTGIQPKETISPAFAVQLGQGIIGHVAMEGQEFLARDVRHEIQYRHLDVLPETCSEVTLPLKIEDRILGVLDLQSDQPDDFDETDMLVLRALAGNISFALEGARLYNTLQHRAGQLSVIYEVSNAIASILDQDKLLNEVVDLIQKRFGYPFVHLFSVHAGRKKIIFEAGSGWRSQILRQQEFTYELEDPHGIIPWVARHAEGVLANDVSQDPRYRPSPLPPDETLSEFTLPLIYAGKVLGILDLQSDRLNSFSEDDRFLFEALADNIAIAMRNANLYRSESWRRQVAESLREVAGLLSADVDLEQVLEAVLVELERTLPLELAAIWLLDEYTERVGSEEAPSLHLAAIRGVGTTDLQLQIGLNPEEVLEYNPACADKLLPEEASQWLLQALESDQPLIRAPYSHYEPLGAAVDFPEDYSAIIAPLRIGEQRLGVLTMAHRSSGRYGGEALAMSSAFASYAAVAIENARLYEEAHEQAWVSTVLLQVAEATQSQTNLNELLDTVIRITPLLAGVKACTIYVLDEDETFVPVASSGLLFDQRSEFERWRFAPGDVPVLDQLMEHRQPVVLHGNEEDARLTSILYPSGMPASSPDTGLLVLVPLLAHGELLGVFLINYSSDLGGSIGGKSLEAFLDERLAIMQGIAYQTAIGVENIRLQKTQREEAYVSVALLQVAQAIVSSNELDEALGAIVRITPILVGVERAAIFLWEPGSALFRLSQSYGIPRDAEARAYAPLNFPLLEAVRQSDSLLACALQAEETESEDILEVWENITPPSLGDIENSLENEACLLLAFPLSLKGEVLGVFLAQEPQLILGEGFSGWQVNRRLREKRLEIITGISQQAALAIQNELLHRELVERERLEREIQLAREIQTTFLPKHIPDLPGWDMKTYWRTARVVGGDFYDFFTLSGKRLGLVIADVADKGMPAALFMTLVRTLVRATVQRVSAPGKVLRQVNDILVPDAHRGMFVTLVYAVLSLETGELEFANAGHNPPLVVRSKECRIERLTRSGMALGVEEGNHILGKRIVLEPGDFIIFYTDGITEAFSPDGDLYGEQRLNQTILDALACQDRSGTPEALSAQTMLEAIDASVTKFANASVASDDSTILVLKRLSPP